MTEQEKAVWIEIVNDCNSSQKSVNVGTQKRRNVINAVNKALNLADVTGSALLNEVKQFRKEQQELHDFTKKEGHPKIAEYTEGGLDVCDKLIKIIEKHYR